MKKIIPIFLNLTFLCSSVFGASLWEKNNLQSFKKNQNTKKTRVTTRSFKKKVPRKATGKVVDIDGNIEIIRSNKEGLEDGKKGDLLQENDQIEVHSGVATLELNNKNRALIKEGSKLSITNGDFFLDHGEGEFLSKKNLSKVDTGYSNLLSRNTNLKVSRKKNGIINAFFSHPNRIEVLSGSVSIRVPKNINSFNVIYDKTNQQLTTKRFTLKKDQIAIFKGSDVVIYTKEETKVPLERDEKNKFYVGTEFWGAYIKRKIERHHIKEESKYIFRPGLNFTLMTKRTKPMYSIAFTTDPQMEELRFDYINPRENFFQQGPLNSTSYYKLSLGIGNTHGEHSTPTHGSFGIGYGWLKKVKEFLFLENFILSTDLNLKKRIWEFDRGGEDRKQKWKEKEFSISTKIMFRLR